jgi:hypothetical protein
MYIETEMLILKILGVQCWSYFKMLHSLDTASFIYFSPSNKHSKLSS